MIVAIGYSLLVVFGAKWNNTEFVIKSALMVFNYFLFILALSYMYKNYKGCILLIVAYSGLQALLGNIFSVFDGSYGPVILQLSILISLLTIYWYEIGLSIPTQCTPKVIGV